MPSAASQTASCPFHLEDGRTAEIHAASIVMKSVQARLPSSSAVDSSALEGSAKLGDDEDKGKAQVSMMAEQGLYRTRAILSVL